MLLPAAAAFTTLMLTNSPIAIPRPEHPRPNFERATWTNLNGSWEFQESDTPVDIDKLTFPDHIMVPFCRESKLSGLARKGFVKNVYYRRTFEKPTWNMRTKFHIDACDYQTTVWLNGKELGTYTGGNSPISFDITDALVEGKNTIVVHAYDDTRGGIQPTGKQAHSEKSEGIMYTRTTGIWQTVWLEGVGESSVESVRVLPDLALSRFNIQASIANWKQGYTLEAIAKAGGKQVAKASCPATWRNAHLSLSIPSPHLWNVGDPFLYDLEFRILDGKKVVDTVKSYAGMRDLAIKDYAILLNGKPVFQRLVLDQGFYPDGVWTAPSDAALKHDIEMSQSVGFNGARLHQKVFEPRYLYWADKLGYLCWGEFPNYGMNHKDPRGERPMMEEWARIVERDMNHPAIIGWCPFNETPSEAGPLQNSVITITKAIDPSRPVIDTSGYIHSLPLPEVMDAHDYDQNPITFKARYDARRHSSPVPERYLPTRKRMPFMLSEYGGIGWDTGSGWGYGNPPKTEQEYFDRLAGLTGALTGNPTMFGFCYTQLTDVEQERNGVFTFDRKPKFDVAKYRAIFGAPAAIEKGQTIRPLQQVQWNVLVGAAVDGPDAQTWSYSLTDPAKGAAWAEGKGGFGSKEGWEDRIGTPWTTPDIWLKSTFSWDGKPFKVAELILHYDNATEVSINGKVVWKSPSGAWNDAYDAFDVTNSLTLKKGTNTIEVHCHQDTGGQFIDVALLVGS